jgi:hypothetical protein
MKNNCTQISTTSCIKYTGPSIPTFNIFCDEDLDVVLTNLASALADTIAQKGLEFSKVKDTACLQFTTEERTRLNLMLDKIVNKVCELYSLKTFTPKANDIIVDLEELFKNQASEYYHCFNEVTAPNCKTTISLTSFISDILSQLCDKFDALQVQIDNAAVQVDQFKYTGAQVKEVMNCQSALTNSQEVSILELLKLAEDKDKSIIQLITGTSACSASTITLAANTLGVGTTQTSVKVALDDIIANVEDAINNYSVTALTPTNSGAFQASLSLAQTSNASSPITATINVAPHYARLYSTWDTGLAISGTSATSSSGTITTVGTRYPIINTDTTPSVILARHIDTADYGIVSSNTNTTTYITRSTDLKWMKIRRAGLYRFELRGYLIIDPTNRPTISSTAIAGTKVVFHLLRRQGSTVVSLARFSQTIEFANAAGNLLYPASFFQFLNLSGLTTYSAAVNDEFGLGISFHSSNTNVFSNDELTADITISFITRHVVSLEATEFPNVATNQ